MSVADSSDATRGGREAAGGSHFDPLQLAVLTARLEGIVRRMTETLVKTARSAVLNTAKDCSCCIVSHDDQVLVSAESLPIHVMSGPDLMAKWLRSYHPDAKKGDAYLHNSPYHGNSHTSDHCILVPVVDDAGHHQFTLMVKAHLADVGNSEPTTLWATCRDMYHEGSLVFNCTKVQEEYRDIDDIIRMCQLRIRVPEAWYGDFLAMVGAARIGEQELLALGEEYGWSRLHEYTQAWFDYSERQMAAAIAEMPAGRSEVTTAFDPIPDVEGAEHGIPLRVTVDIDPVEQRIDVDLRDNPDCLAAGVNLTEATARSAGLVGVFNSLPFVVPQNGGSFRRLTVHLRENCVAGIPVHPVSCSAATFGVSCRIANSTQRAIAEMGTGFGMADCASECPASTAGISGTDPRRNGARFVNLMLLGLTGGGATARTDGWVTSGEVGGGGLMMRDSIEVDELIYPVRIWSDRLVIDGGGPGRHRGAPGCFVEYGPVSTTMEAMWSSDGEVTPALGACGGFPGASACQWLRRSDGALEPLPAWGGARLGPDETVVSFSNGGGGYGRPWERDVTRVEKDVREKWVSIKAARDIYGVAVNEDGTVDQDETACLRTKLSKRDSKPPRRLEIADQMQSLVDLPIRLVDSGEK
jgi:N-methylhydantoinase B